MHQTPFDIAHRATSDDAATRHQRERHLQSVPLDTRRERDAKRYEKGEQPWPGFGWAMWEFVILGPIAAVVLLWCFL